MRTEVQRWDSVRVDLEIVAAGQGQTGMSARCKIQRIADGLYYDNATGLFDSAAAVTISMVELDAVNQPGLYSFSPNLAALTLPSGLAAKGYYYTCGVPNTFITELGSIHIENPAGTGGATAADVWDYDVGTTSGAEKAGSRLRNVSLGLALGEGATNDPLHVSIQHMVAPSGKFYASTTPTPSSDATEAYANRRAMLLTAGRSYPCKINSVATDGLGDYFQLEREDGATWDLEITAFGTQLVVLNDLHQSFDAGAVWSEATAAYTTSGTFGEGFRRILALRQENMRVIYTAWNDVNVPTAGTIYIYPSKAAMDADSGGTGAGSFGSYTFNANFSGVPALQPDVYTSGKVT